MNILPVLEDYLVYLIYTKGLSPTTVQTAKNVNSHFFRKMGITSFNEVTPKIVQDFFINGRIKCGWKPGTFVTYHKTILYFFEYAVKQGYLKENFARNIECPKMPKSLPRSFTKDKAVQWLRYVKNYPYHFKQEFFRKRNHAMYATLMFTGLRRCELSRLELADLDLKNRSLRIRGKGEKDRVISLCSAYIVIMQDWLAVRKKNRKTCPFVFTSWRRNQGLSIGCIEHMHKKLIQDGPFHNTLHQWRHTFATLMIQGGVDLPSVQAMMGHSRIETTMRYVSISNNHLLLQASKHPLNHAHAPV
jgi:site-specific recombinase XerD